MPPRYAYWTIIVDNQPTAFRSGSQEELMPTFKRLKAKNDTAVMMWWQHGKLWTSRVDAQEAMLAGREMGRRADERQTGAGFRDRHERPALSQRRERRGPATSEGREAKGEASTPTPARNADVKLDWKPKGEFVPAPKRDERRDWKSKPSDSEKPAWKPKGSFDRDSKPDWQARTSRPSTYAKAPAARQAYKPSRSEKPEWKPKGSFESEPKSEWQPRRDDGGRFAKPDWKPKPSRSERPEWKPKGSVDRERRPAPKSFEREERPRSFKRPDFKSSADDTRSAKPEWKPKGSFDRRDEWKPHTSRPQAPNSSRPERPEWKPKGSFDRTAEWKSRTARPQDDRSEKPKWTPKGEGSVPDKRKWVPKEEYKKSMGIEARRDSKWRPGGEHKDPKQKFKDAKKAKWTKFKQNIRARSGARGKKQS